MLFHATKIASSSNTLAARLPRSAYRVPDQENETVNERRDGGKEEEKEEEGDRQICMRINTGRLTEIISAGEGARTCL